VKFTDDGAITPAVTLVGTIQPSSVTFDSSFDYTLSGSPIIGSGGFVKNNIGKVTLLNNNTNTGTTVINSGSVVVGNGTTIGALGGSGDITVGGTASLELSRSDAQTLTRKVINGGTLIKSGAGTLTMSSNNNVCDIIVNGGTFAARGGDWANSFAANRTITVNAPGILDTTTHALGGLGGATRPNNIVINEDGIWKLNNEQQLPNTALTLTAGIVNGPGEMRGGGTIATIAHATKSSAINAPINNGNGAVTFNVDDGGVAVDLSVTGNLVGVNTYTKIGIGTMVTTGNNSYTGGTNANGGILEVSSVADAGGVGSIGVYTSGIPGYLGIANDGTFRYTGTGSQTSARNLWIDTGAQNKTIEVTSATGDITFSGTGGNINKPFTKTGAGALTLADVINVGATVTVNGGRLSLTGANAYTGDTAVLAGTLAVNGTAIANTNKLIIDGGKVEPTGTEVVDTLYFGGVQQIAGTWGATGSGATNIDDVRFAGTAGVISVTTGPAGYVTWAGLKGLTSGNNGVSQDPDNDGINNLQEFYFDGDPLANNQAILPQLSSDATYMILTFKRRDDAETDIISQNAQWGSDLIGWTPATITEASAAADANGVIINVVENGTAPDDVTVSIPRANAIGFKLFGRVVIVK
jgi:autotransporter-associated beta strand protein